MKYPKALRSFRWRFQATGLLFCGAYLINAAPAALAQILPLSQGPAANPGLEKKEAEPLDFSNWFDVSVSGAVVEGNKASFQRRLQRPEGGVIGVESFHWQKEISTNLNLKVDGRGVFDNRDYSLKLELEVPEKAFFRVGYNQSRTWYDGSGGWVTNGRWFELFDDEMAVDRGEAWVEAGLILPEKPSITFRYSHAFRDGRKDSTIWGDTALTGGVGTRAIVPSFYDLDEQRDTFTADAKHTIGNTDVGLGLRYELVDNDNTRYMRRAPLAAADRSLTHREGVEWDMFNVHGFTETRLNEKLLFTSGAAFTTLDSDLSGSRFYGPAYDTPFPLASPAAAGWQARDRGFRDLTGGSGLKQYLVNLNLMATPWEHVTIVPSIRIERRDLESVSAFTETDVLAFPAGVVTLDSVEAQSERSLLDVSERLEARYTGIKKWVFYVRGDWTEGNGDLLERQRVTAPTALTRMDRDTDDTRFVQKYTAGANWYPLSRLNFGAQYYHQLRQNNYDHNQSARDFTEFLYPAFITDQNIATHDANLRVTWRIFPNLAAVTRYDYQISQIDTDDTIFDEVESAESINHILSETLTWTPATRLYLQATLNYVWDETDTPAENLTGGSVLDSENHYWTTTATAGFVLTDKTDLETSYFYYTADNWIDRPLAGLSYGAEAEDHGYTVGILHRFSENLRWNLKYGYFDHRESLSGGHNNFRADLIYSSLRYVF